MNLPAWHGKAIVSRTAPPERVAQRGGVFLKTRNPAKEALEVEVGRAPLHHDDRQGRAPASGC